MTDTFGSRHEPRVAASDREQLPDLLTAGAMAPPFSAIGVGALVERSLPSRHVLIGHWSASEDPFPDFMIVNDEDHGDTHAWLSAYAAGLAPITQWVRIWTRSQFRDLLTVSERSSLEHRLASWVGAIIAECAAQSRMQINLKVLSGVLALSSAGYAAARARAVWGHYRHFAELARRHDDLSERLRERVRPIAAGRLLGLWYALAGDGWVGRPPAEDRTLAVFRSLFADPPLPGAPAVERADRIVQLVTDEFDLPDLPACGRGPQRDRVEALDRLGARLGEGPKSAAIDAVLGFGASLVEPGAAVLPELLRRFETAMPTAAIWAGAFAGLWAPVRVLSDHGGLGRLVAKALLAQQDLFAKPQADIAYDELTRWLPGNSGHPPPMRGMVARVLNVELLPGVTAPFQLRPDPVRPTAPPGGPRQPALHLETTEPAHVATPNVAELVALVDALGQRVAALEQRGSKGRRTGPAAMARARKDQ